MKQQTDNILLTLESRRDTFSKTQKRIADYLIQHPDTASFFTLKQLAAATNTTEATILSFARKIGCESFLDLRTKLQTYISQWMSPNEHIRTSILENSAQVSPGGTVIESEVKLLQQTYGYIRQEDLHRAVQQIRSAKSIFLLAADYAAAACSVFEYRFSRLGLNVVNLGNYDPAQLLFSLSRIEQDDLIVLFSFFPYTQLQIALAQFLHTQWGINVLCFTDNVSSPGAKFAGVVLTSSTRSPVFFNSLTAPISQINVLASMYVSSYQEEYSRYNEKLSQLHQMIAQSLPEAEHWLI